jgi:hypothetical protein
MAFSYPATITSIENDEAIIVVSVDGKDMALSVKINSIPFKVCEGKKIIVEGSRNKGLRYREVEPLRLSKETKQKLGKIVENTVGI